MGRQDESFSDCFSMGAARPAAFIALLDSVVLVVTHTHTHTHTQSKRKANEVYYAFVGRFFRAFVRSFVFFGSTA